MTDGAYRRAMTQAFQPLTSSTRESASLPSSTLLVAPVRGAARARELREMISDFDNLDDIGGLARLAAS